MDGYALHAPAPIAPRGAYIRREAIYPRHTRTAMVFAGLLERLSPVLAEKYVLPWAGGTPRIDRLCTAVTSASARPARPLAVPPPLDLATLCREAMRQAWGDGAGPGGTMFEDAARRAVTGLTGEDAADCLAVLASARPVDFYLATRLLAVVAHRAGGSAARQRQAAHRWLPFLASTVRACGKLVPARPAVPGVAVGRLVHYRPDRGNGVRHEGAILLVDQPLPARGPLLLGASGVISRAQADPYLHVNGGPGVPTVTDCRTEIATGRDAVDGSWLAAIDGTTGEVALLPR